MQNLLTLEKEIFQLDENNLETCVESVIQLFGSFSENPYSYNLIICQLVYYSFVSKTQDAQVYISFLNEIDKQEEKCSTVEHKIITIFSQFLLRIKSKESIYLLEKMLENKLIDPELIKNKATLYFSHYKTKDDIPKENLQYSNQFFTNKEELEKDDWKLHKKLVEDGVNPLDIAQALRNDDIDKLQEIATQSNFNFNQSIEPSLYERFSYVSRYNVTLIDYAAFFGSIKCFKYLMLNGANLQSTGKYAVLGGNHEIIHLCEQSNASFVGSYEAAIELHRNEIFYYLYDQKLIEINLIDLGIKCIQFSNFEILSFLMNEGLTINEKIIEEAAKVGNIYLFNMFNKENKVINELLQFSVQSGNIELVQQIIKMDGIKINEDGNIALIIACENECTDVVKLLLKQEGIDINFKNEEDNSPLIIACKNGYYDVMQILLEQDGIDVNIKNKEGKTALIISSESGYSNIVKLLLMHKGIDINAQDNEGCTSLMFACDNGYTEVVKLLLAEPALDVNLKDQDNWVAFTYACRRNNDQIIKLLLGKEGIDINVKDITGLTPFICACRDGNIETVKILLEQKEIDIMAKNNNGWTGIVYACRNKHNEIVKLLLEQEGFDVNMKDNNGYTLLIHACDIGNLEVVKILVEQDKIDINIKDEAELTAITHAFEKGHIDIVKFLIQQKGIEVEERIRANIENQNN